ncbi:MAG TPA: hypothetical protein DIC52_07390 [Candidatus Latescibacteria bacterium]|nr:hypothetical protein [Candidatus Latescibacterota bacterium]
MEQRCAAVAYPVDVHHHFSGLGQVFLSAHDVPLLISRATSTKIQDVFRLDCPIIRRKRLPSM